MANDNQEYFSTLKRLQEIEGAPTPVIPTLEGKNTPKPVHGIFRMGDPRFPTFKFEWHPIVKKVFLIREDVGGFVKRGELVAFEIENQGQAVSAMQIWLRGYRTRDQDRERNPALKAEDY